MVLQLLPALDSGGVETVTIDFAAELARHGHRALVAAEGGRLAHKLAGVGGERIDLPMGRKTPLAVWRNAAAIESIIRRERVDVVHARSRAPAWAGYLAARRAGVRFVTSYHGAYRENLPLKRFYNSVMAKGNPVIAASRSIVDLIAARHRVPRARIAVVHEGVDITRFDPAAVARPRVCALAREWRISGDPRPIIMLPARMSRIKGQAHFIEAAARLKAMRGGEDFLCLLVGGESRKGGHALARALRRQAERQGLERSVRFVGHCADMPAAYLLSDVVVSASLQPEAFGCVAVEAQAMGRPVIGSNHGGSAETILEGRTGWLYPPGSHQALAEAMNAALERPEALRAAMREAARAHVLARYTIARTAEAIMAAYGW